MENNKLRILGYVSLPISFYFGYYYFFKKDKPEQKSLINLKSKLNNLSNNLTTYHENMKIINNKLNNIADNIDKTNQKIKILENKSENENISYFNNLEETNKIIIESEKNLVTEF